MQEQATILQLNKSLISDEGLLCGETFCFSGDFEPNPPKLSLEIDDFDEANHNPKAISGGMVFLRFQMSSSLLFVFDATVCQRHEHAQLVFKGIVAFQTLLADNRNQGSFEGGDQGLLSVVVTLLLGVVHQDDSGCAAARSQMLHDLGSECDFVGACDDERRGEVGF